MSNEPLAPGFPAGRGQAPNRDNKMVEFNCVCGTTTNTKKDGSPWKHQTPDGVPCDQNKLASRVDEVREEADADPVFTFEMNVYYSVSQHLLKDVGWHNENKKLADYKARKAGKSPVGEARLVREDVFDRKVVLVYEVPVREG